MARAKAGARGEPYNWRDYCGHRASGEVVRRRPHVEVDLMDENDPGNCGWGIPIRVGGEWDCLMYHYDSGWQAYASRDKIPAWIWEHLEAHVR